MKSPEEDQAQAAPNQPRRKRGKGVKHLIGRQRKRTRERDAEGTKSMDGKESEGGSSSAITDSEASTSDTGQRRVCMKPVNEPHLCSEPETTLSEWTVTDTDLEETPKRRRKKNLTYRRKYTSRQAHAVVDSDSDTEEEEVDVTGGFDSEDMSTTDSESLSNEENQSTNLDLTCSPLNTSAEIGEETATMSDSDNNDANEPAPAPGADSSAFMNLLVNNMKLLLPTDWIVDTFSDTLRLLTINHTTGNPSVERSIIFNNNEKTFGVFVHGAPVGRESEILKSSSEVDVKNVASLSDYLSALVSRVQAAAVCSGINTHQDFWDLKKGFVDYSLSFDFPSFRSSSCLLLIGGKKNGKCVDCRWILRKLEGEKQKSEKEREDPCSARDKDLSKAGIKFKKDKYKKMAKLEKQRADRNKKRVEILKIKLDEAMNDELLALLRSNQHKMSDIQRTFWLSQLKAMELDDKRGIRWDPMLIRIALHLHSLSPNAYEFLGESKLLALPSKRRLFDYSHFIESKEGCQKDLLLMIKNKAEKCGTENHFSFINLMFDEMHIKSGLVTLRSTGELIGYTKLSGIDEELAKIQKEISLKTYRPRLAKKILVYLARGITSDIKDVAAIFTTDDLSAHQLYDRTWNVVCHLEEVGLKVLALICDGASVNRKFIMMHESLDKASPYTYSTKNLASEDHRPLFFVIDPPHLFKTMRNALANSFSHRKSRTLWKNGENLSWKVLEQVYEITKHLKNPGHRMRKAHIKLSSFSVMTVLYATQALSNSTANCIENLSTHPSMEKFHTKELVSFIRLVNRFFDCVNTRSELSEEEVINADKEPYTNPNDSRLSFLEIEVLNYFEDWKKDVTDRPGTYTDSERNRMIISHQALGSLQITIRSITSAICYMLKAGAPSVGARVFNQDPVEQYFGKLRRKKGDGNNPFVKDALDMRLNLVAQGHASVPTKKGNVQAEKRKQDMEVDSSPLPSRKTVRKSKEL